MINSKKELNYYIKKDLHSRGIKKLKLRHLIFSEELKFQLLLRKSEYYSNKNKSFFSNIMYTYYYYRLKRLGIKLGWTIPLNVFGPGLCIVHRGTVVVNGKAIVGKNCRIQTCVNIGASGGRKEAPIIGDNVYIGPGAKLLGNISIASSVAIGANSVVNKSFLEPGVTIAGVPAKKISSKGSCNLITPIK